MDFGEHLDPVTEARVPKAVTQVLGLLKIGD
jgi:hypothetical protein